MALSREKALINIQKANTPEAKKKMAQTKKNNTLIKGIINEYIKNMLLDESKKGTPQYKEFLDNYIASAKNNPDSQAAQFFADRLISKDLLTALDAEHEKEMQKDSDFAKFRLFNQFYDKQREVMYEINHRRKIMCLTSRRTGKSTMAAGIINEVAIKKDSPVLYFNLTFQNGIKQVYDNVINYSDSIDRIITKKSKSDGTIEWNNGSSLKIFGNSNNAEADKARGFKARCVIIDEIGHQRNIDYLLNEVILPLMADYEDSTLILMGTPSRVPHHFSTKIWEEDSSYRKYNWDLTSNPYIPNAKAFIDEVCKSKGLTIESPFIQREYFGKLVADTEAVIFKNRKTYKDNLIRKIENNEIKITDIAIGVDYGFSDFNSMITVAYNKRDKKSYILKEDKFNRAAVSDIVAVIQSHFLFSKNLLEKQRINAEDHIKIYADTNEESITSELMVKYKLPAYNCFKYDKMFAIEMLAEELRTGRMVIPEGGILDDEMDRILYARNDEDDIINELDDTTYHADAMMALLYASRKVFFDMDYDIEFKETTPKSSDFITNSDGTISQPNFKENADSGNFEDSGIIG